MGRSQDKPQLLFLLVIKPFAPGDFAEKRVLKLVEWFSGHCRAIKSLNLSQTGLQVVHVDPHGRLRAVHAGRIKVGR